MKYKWNINFALCTHPGKSYRSRHNMYNSCPALRKTKTLENVKPEDRGPIRKRKPTRKKKKKKKMDICEFYFLVNVCVLIFVICMRWLKPTPTIETKKEEEIDATMRFPLSCKRSHPIMSCIVRKMRCRESCLVLWFLNASEFPGYYWIYYSVSVFTVSRKLRLRKQRPKT